MRNLLAFTTAFTLALALFACGTAPAFAQAVPSCTTPGAYCRDAGKPATESATASVLNHAIDKASEGLSAITAKLESAAPQAWALAVKGIYANGAASLIVGAILFFAGMIGFVCAFAVGCKTDWDDGPEPVNIFSIFGGIGFGVLFLIGIANFASADSWARVISPDGYLAAQILSNALR